MKFLHAADIHLDSPLAGLRARDDLPDAIVRDCTRRAFAAMIDLAIEEDVAFVVIAGDLYDGDWKDFSTGLFFAEQMQRLGRPCFLLRGNHDARSIISRNLRMPQNVREFSSRTCEAISLPDLGVVLHGHSFPNRAVPEDLSLSYREPVPGLVNIGVLHTSAEDPGEHETYAPCSVGTLALKGYDYWALGHIHARRVLSERPWIVFPGNLQGRHVKETGAKGCTIVTIQDGAVVAAEHRPVDVVRWATLAVDVGGLDAASLIGRLTELVHPAIAAAEGRPLLARLILTGANGLHGPLLADTDQLAAECRNAAIEAGGALWVESVRMRTSPAPQPASDALAPLRAAFDAGLCDPDLIATLLDDFASLRQKLPAALRGSDLAIPDDANDLRALTEDAWQIVADALAAVDRS